MASDSAFRPDVLAGRVALVTGGTSGIGYEIARQLGLHGAKVSVSGRRRDVLDGAVAALSKDGVDAFGVRGDVRRYEDAERMVSETAGRFGGNLDIVVNCAAGNFLATAESMSSNAFRTVMEIDALGTFNVSRAAIGALRASDFPSIINISATLQYGATWYQAHASAAKSAVDSLTRSLALEWGRHGVRVNGIAPGPIRGTAGMSKLAPGDEGAAEEMVAMTVPLGVMGDKTDIAYAAVYLSSRAAKYVSGQVLVVDGAAWMWKPQFIDPESVENVSKNVEKSSRKIGVQSKI